MDLVTLAWYGLGTLVAILVLDVLAAPIGVALRILANACLGAVALLLLNTVLGWTSISLAVNPVSAVIAGMLGAPGVALLLMMRAILS
jgi:inhibitor of the pro-sigma K processing machinery